MTVLKLLSRKRISRELFKVCRLHQFESLAQIEAYFAEHRSFDGLEWCGPAEKKELEALVGAELQRLATRWEIPAGFMESPSVLRIADYLLQEREVLPEKQLQVLLRSFRIYNDSKSMTPAEVGAEMELTEGSVRRLRKLALKGIAERLQSLKPIKEDLQGCAGLDPDAPLLLIGEAQARQLNAGAGTDFSPQFLGLLLGEYLGERYSRLGNPEEVLSGNLLSLRHVWKHFYLLRKDVLEGIDLEALMQESERLLRHSGVRQLDFRNFVSLFVRESAQGELDPLLPVVAEILWREFGFKVEGQGQLVFPPRKTFLLCQYSQEALEALGEPSRLEVIRQKVEELHPGVVVDSERFDLVLLNKWGFTSYKQLYALKKWYGGKKLNSLPAAELKALLEVRPKRTGDYWKAHWEQQLNALQAFTEENSRLPEKDGPVEEKILWDWLRKQMAHRRNGELDPLQQRLYDAFREAYPVRSGKFWKDLWMQRFEELKEFAQRHHRRPRGGSPPEELRLHRWFKQQRVRLNKGKLSIDQKVLLREFTERYPLKPLSNWEFRFRQLKEFTELHSRLPGQEAEGEERRLNFFWLYLLERKNQGKFTAEEEALITELKEKYPYNSDHHKQRWDQRFEELKAFASEHGVPKGHKLTGRAKTLRGWLITQRLRLNKGELDSRQRRLIREFDTQYELRRGRQPLSVWEQKFRALEAFSESRGRLPNPEVEEEGRLYRWLMTQRGRLKRDALEPRELELLTEFMQHFPLKDGEYQERRWHEKFDEVEQFSETHGRLPFSTAEGAKHLYHWLRLQRDKAAAGKLDDRQQERLRDLEERFQQKSQLDLYWDRRYAELRDFVSAEGRLPRKSTENSLWAWFRKQLKYMEEGRLNARQARKMKLLRRR